MRGTPWAAPRGTKKPINDTWLAPWSADAAGGGVANEVWITFEFPTSLSLLRLLNYSKDPSRGVAERVEARVATLEALGRALGVAQTPAPDLGLAQVGLVGPERLAL